MYAIVHGVHRRPSIEWLLWLKPVGHNENRLGPRPILYASLGVRIFEIIILCITFKIIIIKN